MSYSTFTRPVAAGPERLAVATRLIIDKEPLPRDHTSYRKPARSKTPNIAAFYGEARKRVVEWKRSCLERAAVTCSQKLCSPCIIMEVRLQRVVVIQLVYVVRRQQLMFSIYRMRNCQRPAGGHDSLRLP